MQVVGRESVREYCGSARAWTLASSACGPDTMDQEDEDADLAAHTTSTRRRLGMGDLLEKKISRWQTACKNKLNYWKRPMSKLNDHKDTDEAWGKPNEAWGKPNEVWGKPVLP